MSEPRPFFLAPDFLAKLARLRLVAKKLALSAAGGEHRSRRRGFSLEFSDFRNYQRGDDLRYVDWNAYRRLQRLFVKLFVAEEEMNVYLLVDTSASMAEGDPSKLAMAKNVAAALGYIGLKNLDRVAAAGFSGGKLSALGLGRGKKQILSLFRFLDGLAPGGETAIADSFQAFSSSFAQPGLVVVISDFLDPDGWRVGVETLANRRHQPLLVQILDESEISPRTVGDVSMIDVESGREKGFLVDEDGLQEFRAEMTAYCEAIESFCALRRIDYLRTTTSVPFADFVLRGLRRVRSVN